MTLKLGRLAPTLAFYDRFPYLSDYLDTTKLPPVPASADWLAKVTAPFGMDGNDSVGDCTIAAVGHTALVLSSNVGAGHQPTETDLVAEYLKLTGGQDTGLMIQTVMGHWAKDGIAGDTIAAFGKLDPKNLDEVKQSVALFGSSTLGITLPKFVTKALDQGQIVPWDIPADGDMTFDPAGGHCVPIFKYDPGGPVCITWGQVMPMSWAFFQAVIEEAWAPISPDFIAASGTAPDNLNLAAMQADMRLIVARS